ncbi:DUF2075 domain-containing protein [Henriciella sp.]|uniref:DUF2075 domain-containing protein n=1 Tax=Henriciella sp. TaxID=1968823 RepID=UPI00262F85E1|nr:DUF2075 domain-containing protein [Henriciella sp.]
MLQTSYYDAPIGKFLSTPSDELLGVLSRGHSFDLNDLQRDAWLSQIDVLRRELNDLQTGHLWFEFAIPRMGKRADVVLLYRNIIFVIEFKVGAAEFDRSSIDQVHDYALDLKNFHQGSHEALIVPVLIATRARPRSSHFINYARDRVAEPVCHNGSDLRRFLDETADELEGLPVDPASWAGAGYLPTPTIVEAAQALYQDHAVEEIARSDAGAQNLNTTTNCVRSIIQEAKAKRQKAICFVTGVPGSGKTLAGLNIATESAHREADEHAVFLSGNGPLVTVLREALARDQRARTGCKKQTAAREVASFVQNIHHFRDDALRSEKAPAERIVIFDEAQRAWTLDQASKFMRQKRGQSNFDQSEPDFLIGVMDRHEDWCVIICLVGGGQEINTGEAGLSEWISALESHYPDWKVYLSDRLADPDYGIGTIADELRSDDRITWLHDLHLAVSMRSFRAESLSTFVSHVLENRPEEARRAFQAIRDRYPMAITRQLENARAWLRERARGSERFGFMASSGAYRLRPTGLNVRAKVDPANWFLNGPQDVRSAYYLEEVATEFDVQGLEVDWAGVCWDGDLRRDNGAWASFAFKGTAWQNVNAADRQLYLKNAYRVILTRARQGMIIYVPKGDPADPTRDPVMYNEIASYLMDCGIPQLKEARSFIGPCGL